MALKEYPSEICHANVRASASRETTYSSEKPPQEKCGLGAVMLLNAGDNSDLGLLLEARAQITSVLYEVRNRGQDSTGVAFKDQNRRIVFAGGIGIVTEAFPPEKPIPLSDTYVGHVRYGTVKVNESESGENLQQPIVVSYNGLTMALAHNGNIPDRYRKEVREKIPKDILDREDLTLDSAELAWAIVTDPGKTWEERMHVLDDVPGAFQIMMLTQDENNQQAIYSLADRTGMWPLVVGSNEYMIVMASENTGIPPGMEGNHVEPGQLVKATRDGIEIKQFYNDTHRVRCILQDAYGINRNAELKNGLTGKDFSIAIGREVAKQLVHISADAIVVGVPQSGLTIAQSIADVRGVIPQEVIKKSNGKRTFITSTHEERQKMAEKKYVFENPELLQGKKLIIVDDSAIRGTTLKALYRKLKTTGVSEIHLVAGLPKVVGGCEFGYNINVDQGLIALRRDLHEGQEVSVLRTDKEIIQEITGEETPSIPIFIHFLSRQGLLNVYAETMNLGPEHICQACTGGPGPDRLIQLTRKPNRRNGTLANEPVLV